MGPNNDVQRFLGFREGMADLLSKVTPDSRPLFQSMASQVAATFKHKGHVYPADTSEQNHTWQLIRERGWYVSPGEPLQP